jgi:chromosome partitioning protein
MFQPKLEPCQWGLANFLDTMNKIRGAINPGLRIEGLLLTMFDGRVSLGHQVRAEVEKFFPGSIFKTTIPRNVRLAEAPSFGQPIMQYDPKSRGAEAYNALAWEVLSKRGLHMAEPAHEERTDAVVAEVS